MKFGLSMMKRNRRVFLDTSVIIAAVLSETGGARKLFRLGEAGIIQLGVGSSVLRECEDVVRRKVPASLPTLAYLLELGRMQISRKSIDDLVGQERGIVDNEPDAYVLAEAMSVEPNWFITHDKAHFLKANTETGLTFRIGTPGDLIQALEDEFTQS